MFIAHLPAGYLLGKAVSKAKLTYKKRLVIWTAIGSVLPDIDMLYFYLIDNQSTHHRHYLSHWPLTWIALLLFSLALLKWWPRISVIPFAIAIGGLLHMILDSVAAPVFWLAPFSETQIELVKIPAVYDNYIWSFILHWTFLVEILICCIAIIVAFANRAKTHLRPTPGTP